MTGISHLPVEIERLLGAQLVRAKFKGLYCRLFLRESSLSDSGWSANQNRI